MPQFEKGKGARKRSISLCQFGNLLTKDETNGPSTMLTGFRRCSSEEDARAELLREALAALAAGLAPVDEAARAIAALAPAKSDRSEVALPFRQDIFVENEATGMMLTSRRMAGKELEDGSPDWQKAIARGDFLPMSLIQDDPFTIRVVVGGDLLPDEAEEWVARLDWHLNVKDGRLCITGGAPLVFPGYSPDDSFLEQFIRELQIPKGHYRVSLYTYVPGINGASVLEYLSAGKPEPWGRWFRRTRNEMMPAWLQHECRTDPSQDPGHEAEWRDSLPAAQCDSPQWIDFLVHLEPVEKALPASSGATLPEDGWFGEAMGGRIPERCPRGVLAHNVIGRESPQGAGWTFAENIAALFGERPLEPVEGGPVCIALQELVLPVQLAWFCSRMVAAEFRLKPPPGVFIETTCPLADGMVWAPCGDEVRLIFSNDFPLSAVISRLRASAELFAGLPEGTVIDLYTSPTADLPGCNPEVGRHHYSGTVQERSWQITGTYPPVQEQPLHAAFALAREVLHGDVIRIESSAEGKTVLNWAKANFADRLEGNSASIKKGVIRLEAPDQELLAFCGAAAFATRFGDVWPVVTFAAGDGWDEDDELPEQHLQGATVLRAPSKRVYYQTMSLLTSESLAKKVQAEEPALKAKRFAHIGDVLCDLYPHVAFRGYAQAGGTIWAILSLAVPDRLLLELSTMFADGASLITGRSPRSGDDLARKTYRQSAPQADIGELLERHERRARELEQSHGPALPAVATINGLADSIEAEFRKQLG